MDRPNFLNFNQMMDSVACNKGSYVILLHDCCRSANPKKWEEYKKEKADLKKNHRGVDSDNEDEKKAMIKEEDVKQNRRNLVEVFACQNTKKTDVNSKFLELFQYHVFVAQKENNRLIRIPQDISTFAG